MASSCEQSSSLGNGLPTAAVVRSSQATPARRRGQACVGVHRAESIAFGAGPSIPMMLKGATNMISFRTIVVS
jgi:hypothetical protein